MTTYKTTIMSTEKSYKYIAPKLEYLVIKDTLGLEVGDKLVPVEIGLGQTYYRKDPVGAYTRVLIHEWMVEKESDYFQAIVPIRWSDDDMFAFGCWLTRQHNRGSKRTSIREWIEDTKATHPPPQPSPA